MAHDDAGHMLSDSASLELAFFAVWLAAKLSPTEASVISGSRSWPRSPMASRSWLSPSGSSTRRPGAYSSRRRSWADGCLPWPCWGSWSTSSESSSSLAEGKSLNVEGILRHVLDDVPGLVSAIIAAGTIIFYRLALRRSPDQRPDRHPGPGQLAEALNPNYS